MWIQQCQLEGRHGLTLLHWSFRLHRQRHSHYVVVGKKTCMALSSCESEYRALVEASKEVVSITNLYQELGFLHDKSAVIYYDNQSSIKISKNPQYHSKKKHFEIHLYFVRDMVNKKQILVLFIPTTQ